MLQFIYIIKINDFPLVRRQFRKGTHKKSGIGILVFVFQKLIFYGEFVTILLKILHSFFLLDRVDYPIP